MIPTKGRRRRGQNVEEAGSHVLERHKSFAMRHIDYEASMVAAGIVGIYDVDKTVNIMPVTEPGKK